MLFRSLLDQVKVEVTFDGKILRAKISGVPGKDTITSPPGEIVKIDTKAKTMDTRDEKGEVSLDVYEFLSNDKLRIRSGKKTRPAKANVPDEKSDDDYLELERVQ